MAAPFSLLNWHATAAHAVPSRYKSGILNIALHLLFDVRVIKGFDAGSKSFLNLLLVKPAV